MPVTLLDIAKANNSDREVGLIEEVVPFIPELKLIPARTIKGIQYKTLVRTSLPSVGFRAANRGVADSFSTLENRNVECFIVNPQWVADKAVADAYEDGAPAYIAMEATGMTQAAMIALAKQFYYGAASGGDSEGHPGLVQGHDSSMVVDATGDTASTASSVWAVKFGPQNVQWVFGNGGDMSVSDPQVMRVLDSQNRPYTAYTQNMLFRPGLQVGSIYSVARIKNLTAQTNKTLNDDMLSDLMALFPVGHEPDAIFMSRRSLSQLRKSRTATNATGTPAPTPTDFEGCPIIRTDAILNTEAIS
ncbi:major capsid protein [Anatilimnocola floriformis]|uniref:major capsid protein n=1 Tax=Anatilimnocola floriformis TaxID=2948575 RepID=UPI0020C46A62|nr:hypothetical protein [Anatilimnocola floriformis]